MIDQKDDFDNQSAAKPETAQPQEEAYTAEDIERGKTMAGLSYLLFFLPLVVCPDSRYARFHANQALLLLIVGIAGNVVLRMIPFIGWMLIPIYGLGIFAFGVMGLINGFGGKAKPLPLIGKYTIIK